MWFERDYMSDKNSNNGKIHEQWASYILPVVVIAGLVALLTVFADQPIESLPSIIPQEDWITNIAGYVIIAAEGGAAIVIGVAVIHALFSYVKHLLDPMDSQINATERIRLRLGHM